MIVEIKERLNGKLCILYYYNNEWIVSTKMTADGTEVYSQQQLIMPKDTKEGNT